MREGFRRKLEEEVDPDHTLRLRDPQDFYRRLQAKQAAHIASMRLAKAERTDLRDRYGKSSEK
jgi:hypothetical protein